MKSENESTPNPMECHKYLLLFKDTHLSISKINMPLGS